MRAFCVAASASAPGRDDGMCASSDATEVAMSRITVSMVPSAGARTESYARWAERAIAEPISTGSTSSPGREISSSAAPRTSWERITPLLPRAPSSAARATDSTIWSRPISSIVCSPSACARRSTSSRQARSVSAMLSPVSPSATGNTFRSLISARRDSRCASAPSTAARKRTRLGSGRDGGTARTCAPGSDGLDDLAGLQAARADVDALRRLADEDPHLLQVRVEPAPRRHHRVRAAVSERGALPAAVTDLGHEGVEVYCPTGSGTVRTMPATEQRVSLPPRYRVLRHIANGGMASVWAAEDELLGRLVAVKMLSRAYDADERAPPPLLREGPAPPRLGARRPLGPLSDHRGAARPPVILVGHIPRPPRGRGPPPPPPPPTTRAGTPPARPW